MIAYLKAIWDTLVSMNPVIAALLFVATFMISVFNFINDLIGELLAKMATLILEPQAAAMAIDGMAWFNYAFPLTELFTFGTMLCAAYALAALIRIIKSFIPTVA